MPITVYVPGKLMLLGEHAVVYGYSCIVTTVDRYLTVRVKKINREKRSKYLSSKDRILIPDVSDDKFVRETIAVFRDKFSIKQPIYLETKSKLGDYGLGSSAAVIVATLKALVKLFNISLDKKKLFNLSYEVVQKVQGLGSGFDVASCIWEGTVYFASKSKRVKKLTNEKLPLVVGFCGNKADTVKMVNKVRRLKEENSKLVKDIFKLVAALVKIGKKAIVDKNWISLGKLMTENHLLLKKLGVSTDKLDKLVSAACQAGAYGAKLSGAGGGDCMIALVSKKRKKNVELAIKKIGGEIVS